MPTIESFEVARTIELGSITEGETLYFTQESETVFGEPPFGDCTCSECEMARQQDRDDDPRDVTQPEDKTLTYEVTVQGRHKLAPKYRRTYTVEVRVPSRFGPSQAAQVDREAESRAINYAEQDGFATTFDRRREADPYRFKIIKTVLVNERIPMTTAC